MHINKTNVIQKSNKNGCNENCCSCFHVRGAFSNLFLEPFTRLKFRTILYRNIHFNKKLISVWFCYLEFERSLSTQRNVTASQ